MVIDLTKLPMCSKMADSQSTGSLTCVPSWKFVSQTVPIGLISAKLCNS